MKQVIVSPASDAVAQTAGVRVFVEGGSPLAMDPCVITPLLPPSVTVSPLGNSMQLHIAAKAFTEYHKRYYFIVDRDHYSDITVEDSWSEFPNGKYPNLLYWRKREIENYFLDPTFICTSKYCQRSVEQVRTRLMSIASRRVFFDMCNMLIIRTREQLKSTGLKIIKNLALVSSEDHARAIINDTLGSEHLHCSFGKKLNISELQDEFSKYIVEWLDGAKEPFYSKGRWSDLMCGKEATAELIDYACEVVNVNSERVTGSTAIREVARDLCSLKNMQHWPDDFKQLYQLFNDIVSDSD